MTARSAANLLGIYPYSATLFYKKIRIEVSGHLAFEAGKVFDGEIEMVEKYFGGARKGHRDRAAAGETIVFLYLKCTEESIQ